MTARSWVRNAAPWLVIAFIVAVSAAACAAAEQPPAGGAWTLSSSSDGNVDVGLTAHVGGSTWDDTRTQPFDALGGLTREQLGGAGENVHFTIARDAGSLQCIGWVAHGSGGGTFAFVPSGTFLNELARRGVGAPTPMEQFEMTMEGVSLAYIDELRRLGFAFSASDVMRAANHGVDKAYIDGIVASGYHPQSLDSLIRMRDHGVDMRYVKALNDAGLHPTADEAVRLRDHGVSAEFVGGLHRLGYTATVEQIVRLVDHGVSLDYIEHVRAAGYHPTADELIRLRDAGI